MTTLTMKDEKRIEVILRVDRKELTVGQAALVMGLSERQCYQAGSLRLEPRAWFTATEGGRVDAGSETVPYGES